jgi:hypothetical protein
VYEDGCRGTGNFHLNDFDFDRLISKKRHLVKIRSLAGRMGSISQKQKKTVVGAEISLARSRLALSAPTTNLQSLNKNTYD